MKSIALSVMSALVFTAAAAAATVASAAIVTFSGSGTFDAGAPTSVYSAPGESWAFSFSLPNPISSNPTTDATGFTYSLNGSPVADSLSSITFFTSGQSGLFDLNFASGGVVSLYGADIGSTLTISTGSFPATIGLDGGAAIGSGVVNVGAVPEASTWAMMLAGFAGLGWLGYRRSSRGALAS